MPGCMLHDKCNLSGFGGVSDFVMQCFVKLSSYQGADGNRMLSSYYKQQNNFKVAEISIHGTSDEFYLRPFAAQQC